jgi:hypothetical protein
MAMLKEPQKQIPGGYRFLEPSTKWEPQPFSSLDSITTQLISHRKGRPDLIARNNWSLDPAIVIQEVIAYNVALCQRNGWNDYLVGGGEGSVPFPTAPPPTVLQRAKNLAVGASTLVDWISSGAEAVAPELANKRASTCAKMFPGRTDAEGKLIEACPLNKAGDWLSVFTVPVQAEIQAALERRKQMNLSTLYDDELNVCEGCGCPLKLKVHLPLDRILSKMKPETQAALHPSCWIRTLDQ